MGLAAGDVDAVDRRVAGQPAVVGIVPRQHLDHLRQARQSSSYQVISLRISGL